MILWAHPSPQPKWHVDRFSLFCTDDHRLSLYFTVGCTFPPELPLPMGMWNSSPATLNWSQPVLMERCTAVVISWPTSFPQNSIDRLINLVQRLAVDIKRIMPSPHSLVMLPHFSGGLCSHNQPENYWLRSYRIRICHQPVTGIKYH